MPRTTTRRRHAKLLLGSFVQDARADGEPSRGVRHPQMIENGTGHSASSAAERAHLGRSSPRAAARSSERSWVIEGDLLVCAHSAL
eukprot:COSAG06_NODE_2335_length_7057_cov_3.119414_4_plen_86_part_00